MRSYQACCLGLVLLLGAAGNVEAGDIQAAPLEYQAGQVLCEGWHAYDAGKQGKRPGILIVHQWTGLSDYEKMRAAMLARDGYNVLAADIYGKGVRPQPPESGKESAKYKNDRTLYRERLLAALEVLKKHELTDGNRLFVIGYCFGGTGALEVARSGADVLGVVSFHGSLSTPTPEDAENITCAVLVCHGADDPFVPEEEVAAFREEMKNAEIDYDLVAYPGAVHAFTQKEAGNDNSKGAAYHADADQKSWLAMIRFFGKLLAQ